MSRGRENADTRISAEAVMDVLTATPALTPPENLTARVMAQVRLSPPATGNAAPSAPYVGVTRWRTLIWPPSTGIKECALCFFLAGFFLLMLGGVLTLGLRPLAASASLAEWLTYQPPIALLSGLLLIVSGAAITLQRPGAWRAARTASLLYLVFTVLNGWILCQLPLPPFSTAGWLMYTLGALLLGFFLLLTVEYCRMDRIGSRPSGDPCPPGSMPPVEQQ